jgi:tetratricopeptide (TPR) repeat protein
MGRYPEARRLLEESLAIARALGSAKKIGAVLQPLGMAALGEGDRATARRCLTESLAIARSLGNPRDVATAANDLGQLHRLEMRQDAAAALFEESIRISRADGDRDMAAIGLLNLAMLSGSRGSGRFARECVAEALETAQALRSQPLLKSVLEVAAGLAAMEGDHATAVRFYGAAEAQAAKTGLRRDAADAAFLAPLVQASAAELGPSSFARIEEEGRALALAQAAAQAREWLRAPAGVPSPTYR